MDDVQPLSRISTGTGGLNVLCEDLFIPDQGYGEVCLISSEKCAGNQFLWAMVSSHGIQGNLHCAHPLEFGI